ncbi:MAG: 2-C-methyl-D-erythritol 4-phosphate cytidylyltransferase [Pseudomonadales bacterium]|nr:2-C-methyl-D-erythritol 4-phosphate cytidylyltransferase [Pseudomonadales bacterium]
MSDSLSDLVFVVPAAGVGTRMNAGISKQYLLLGGKPILQHCLEKLLSLSPKNIVLVVSPDDKAWKSIPAANNCLVVEGGALRSDSVLNGLNAIDGKDSDWIMVHDCVRPCFQREDILRLYGRLKKHAVGGLLGVPVIDTLKQINPQIEVVQTWDRNQYWLAQTPQMFRLGMLKEALGQSCEFSDEASAIENLGHRPLMVEGNRHNIKITTQEDMALAEFLIQSNILRKSS